MNNDSYSNPYDSGIVGNWYRVMGKRNFILGMLPAVRAPPFPPWPKHVQGSHGSGKGEDAYAHIV